MTGKESANYLVGNVELVIPRIQCFYCQIDVGHFVSRLVFVHKDSLAAEVRKAISALPSVPISFSSETGTKRLGQQSLGKQMPPFFTSAGSRC